MKAFEFSLVFDMEIIYSFSIGIAWPEKSIGSHEEQKIKTLACTENLVSVAGKAPVIKKKYFTK